MERPVLRELWNKDKSIRKGRLLRFRGTRLGKNNSGGNPQIQNVYYYDTQLKYWRFVANHVYLDIHSSLIDAETFTIFKILMKKDTRGKHIIFTAYIRPYNGGIGLVVKQGSTLEFR